MQSPEGSPLRDWLGDINLDAFGFDKNQALVDTLHLRDELFLADGSGVWLTERAVNIAIISHSGAFARLAAARLLVAFESGQQAVLVMLGEVHIKVALAVHIRG